MCRWCSRNGWRDLLVSMGLQEVVTYGLTMPEREAPLGQAGDYVTLVNPISSDRVVMRHTVLARVLDGAAENLKHETDVRLFELGPVYLPCVGQRLPAELRRLCAGADLHAWPSSGPIQ